MPRGPRLDIEGALHHVMGRGIERCDIYRSDLDREDWLTRVRDLAPGTGTSVYAWALMPNHFHLLVRSGACGLCTFMRRLQTGYALAFNRRHDRPGHLFQNRFKSILVEEEPYFLELVRYIHLNPLRRRLVKDLADLGDYPWSGHAVLIGRRSHPWQDTNTVLRRFGADPRSARRAYLQFIAGGLELGRRPDLANGKAFRASWEAGGIAPSRRGRESWASDERILGGEEFIERVFQASQRGKPSKLGAQKADRVLAGLLADLAARGEVSVAAVLGPGRRREVSRIRAALAWAAVVRLGIPTVRVAEFLGVTSPAVSGSLESGRKQLEGGEIDWRRWEDEYTK